MTKIALLDKGTFPPEFKLTRPQFNHEWVEYDTTSPAQIIERLQDIDIAITNKVKFPKEVIENSPNLKMIAIAATGYDHIDLGETNARGIVVSNIKGYAVHSVPEHAMALMLSLARSLPGFAQDVTQGKWQDAQHFCFFNHPIESLHDKTLGIIGRGILGQGLARLASGFGMGIMYAGRPNDNNPHKPYVPFDEFLAQSDFISIHCPLNQDTKDLITATEFAKMSKKPIIINTGRGGIVNEADAVKAIETGQIRGLGFDCLSTEPPAPDNPLLKIAHLPNVIITPHVAWASNEAIRTLWDQLIANIENFQKGTPQNTVS